MTKPISEYQRGRIAAFFDGIVASATTILQANDVTQVIVDNKNEKVVRKQMIKNDQFKIDIQITVTRR